MWQLSDSMGSAFLKQTGCRVLTAGFGSANWVFMPLTFTELESVASVWTPRGPCEHIQCRSYGTSSENQNFTELEPEEVFFTFSYLLYKDNLKTIRLPGYLYESPTDPSVHSDDPRHEDFS
ncbi:hypothetical protein ATANTOWER_018972 [Ataeniobius toweri]|uniref:Uncharacterized protein n=1 Tax=Ataeniobius toweri TaxID=208326 RepID=A0ABU7CCA8_9TELE|nr:hypothetical protein [Ataeniobius toweri]